MLLHSKRLAVCISCFSIAVVGGLALSGDDYSEKPGTQGNGNYTIGPDYKIDPDLTDRGNP